MCAASRELVYWFSLLCVMGVSHHYHVCSTLGTGVDGGGSTNGSTTPSLRSRTIVLMSTLHAPPKKEATASSFFWNRARPVGTHSKCQAAAGQQCDLETPRRISTTLHLSAIVERRDRGQRSFQNSQCTSSTPFFQFDHVDHRITSMKRMRTPSSRDCVGAKPQPPKPSTAT